LEASFILVFFGIFAIGFLGSLPVNPINLCALEIGLRRSALPFSLGAALVETGQSAVALVFGQMAGQFLETNPVISVIAAIFALLLDASYLIPRKKTAAQLLPGNRRIFLYGLMIGFMNPQAIAFWILVLTYWSTWDLPCLFYGGAPVILLLGYFGGVGIAEFTALQAYALAGKHLAGKFSGILQGSLLNKVIGFLLLGLGLVQLIA